GDLVKYAQEVGADGITFQPVDIRDVEGYDTHSLADDRQKLLDAADTLIAMKQEGAPITNTVEHLRLFKAYFTDPFAEDGYEGRQQCKVGNTSIEIHSDGRVQFCHEIGILGNVLEKPLPEIWRSHVANQHRGDIAGCSKGCLQTCYANKTFAQKARM